MNDDTLEIGSREFSLIRDLFKERTGIYIRNTRRDYLEYRIKDRMAVNNIKTAEEYYHFLKYSPGTSGEFQSMINLVTVQETSFFRNPDQLNTFKETILKRIEERKKKEGDNNIKVWSAVCSTGEEPLTLAMILTESLLYSFNWKIEVLATDISTRALDLARKAVYPPSRFVDMDVEMVNRFFTPLGDDFLARRSLTEMVNFMRVNLTSPSEVSMVARPSSLDIIFCRNVFIYFPSEVQEEIATTFFKLLAPGGYLFLGNAESIDIRRVPFTMTFLPGGMIYQKPDKAGAVKSPA